MCAIWGASFREGLLDYFFLGGGGFLSEFYGILNGASVCNWVTDFASAVPRKHDYLMSNTYGYAAKFIGLNKTL